MSHFSLCLYVCVCVWCVCVLLCLHTPTRVCHGLISALADTQGGQLCVLLAVSQERVRWKGGGLGEVKGQGVVE